MDSTTFRKALEEELGGDVELPTHLVSQLIKKGILSNVDRRLSGCYDLSERHLEQARKFLIQPIFSKWRLSNEHR